MCENMSLMKTKILITSFLVASICIVAYIIKKPKTPVVTHAKDVHMHAVPFSKLPGWDNANLRASLGAFQRSCGVFLKHDPERLVGSEFISMRAKHWYPACNAAMQLKNPSDNEIRNFFQTWFKPFAMCNSKPVKGLFTGYYSPLFKGSLKKTPYYSVPIYGLPKQLITAHLNKFNAEFKNKKIIGRVVGQQLVPYYTSQQIDAGALDGVAPVIAWVHSPLERLTLGIEGSGIVKLTNGKKLVLGYAGENGAPYTAIAKVLIEKGVMTYDNASMQHIAEYFKQHPNQMQTILHRNKSFVFFTVLKQPDALGAQGIALTPGYSMAVDRHWLPMGAPLWLTTTRPNEDGTTQKKLHRLMIAQDTGGAIRGPVRGDFYWGAGERAAAIAGRMKNHGYYWVLLPKEIA